MFECTQALQVTLSTKRLYEGRVGYDQSTITESALRSACHAVSVVIGNHAM
jgi:hypothetical protein